MLHTIDDIAIATVADTPLPTELPKQGQIHELDPQKAYVTIMPFAKKDGGFELILQKVIPGSCIAFSEFDRDILGLTNSEKLNDIQYRIKSE